ncbi:hypothetical protein OV079_41790 [Nannocystis pusilla]|uniref:Uncharacterized protein n=1 Tax=Nannocystis pusilla TaxID=889268 RepID=A0A9X3EYS3_9BACT|nr:hypothetical protein [Nannocystis pusilla]MCY1011970.1 hypothetical protein [Nannocystis pusilla]
MMKGVPVVSVVSPLSLVVVGFAVVGFGAVEPAVEGLPPVVEVVSTRVVSLVVPGPPVVPGPLVVPGESMVSVSAGDFGPQAQARARANQTTRRRGWGAMPPRISQNFRLKI